MCGQFETENDQNSVVARGASATFLTLPHDGQIVSRSASRVAAAARRQRSAKGRTGRVPLPKRSVTAGAFRPRTWLMRTRPRPDKLIDFVGAMCTNRVSTIRVSGSSSDPAKMPHLARLDWFPHHPQPEPVEVRSNLSREVRESRIHRKISHRWP